MDFFEHQERARRSSSRLVYLFGLAVAGMVAVLYFAVLVAFALEAGGATAGMDLWVPELFVGVALAVAVVVGIGSAWKLLRLRGGGEVVATRMGGCRLDPGSRDWQERRLLNVVEEMAIASGTPVPAVFLMEREEAINAFAAGHAEGDAVIGVTRGAMEKLSRDELQGVIAHEFSHVLNGDMRLNLRLMGVVHGILLLGIIGRVMLYGGAGRRRSGDRDRGGGGGGGIALVAVALLVVGYIGTFFGSLIKAAVSRQREFLADASAVQFTRDPSGIGGALRKIGGLARGSRLEAAYATEASHMFFGNGLKRASGMLSTHPPLEERVRRIEPGFQGSFEAVAASYVAPPEPELAALAGAGWADGGHEGHRAMAGFAGAAAGAAALREGPPARTTRAGHRGGMRGEGGSEPLAAGGGEGDDVRPGPAGAAALEHIGSPTPEHVVRARSLLAAVPEPLRDAAHDPVGARALVHALLLGDGAGDAAAEARALEASEGEAVAAAAAALTPAVEALAPEARLPLVEIAAGTLTALSRSEAEAFLRALDDVAAADGVLELEEWLLVQMLRRHLEQHLDPTRAGSPGYRSLGPFTAECEVLLSALAHAGHTDAAGAAEAFAAAAAALGPKGLELRPREEAWTPRLLEASLGTLRGLVPALKRRLIAACATCVGADGRVEAREAELFRVVADGLGVPVPPLLPERRLA